LTQNVSLFGDSDSPVASAYERALSRAAQLGLVQVPERFYRIEIGLSGLSDAQRLDLTSPSLAEFLESRVGVKASVQLLPTFPGGEWQQGRELEAPALVLEVISIDRLTDTPGGSLPQESPSKSRSRFVGIASVGIAPAGTTFDSTNSKISRSGESPPDGAPELKRLGALSRELQDALSLLSDRCYAAEGAKKPRGH